MYDKVTLDTLLLISVLCSASVRWKQQATIIFLGGMGKGWTKPYKETLTQKKKMKVESLSPQCSSSYSLPHKAYEASTNYLGDTSKIILEVPGSHRTPRCPYLSCLSCIHKRHQMAPNNKLDPKNCDQIAR